MMLQCCEFWQIIVQVWQLITLRWIDAAVRRYQVPQQIMTHKTPRNEVVKVIIFWMQKFVCIDTMDRGRQSSSPYPNSCAAWSVSFWPQGESIYWGWLAHWDFSFAETKSGSSKQNPLECYSAYADMRPTPDSERYRNPSHLCIERIGFHFLMSGNV